MRLRFAPSPTGSLHVGSARTALFNWLYAKHYGGEFLLRIEDTDRARSTEDSTRAIFLAFEWLGLTWDGDVVYQGANLLRHQADVGRLLDHDKAYRCFCTATELEARRQEALGRNETFRYDGRCDRLAKDDVARRLASGAPFSVRCRLPAGETSWVDLVHGLITFPNADIGEGDFIILRSDGTPVYNMAVVSDDIAMGITLVMRGDDHISNTPKHIILFEALGATVPEFAHLPMIHGPDGKKLSKRHGATAVADYQHLGILPEAMLNFLALLGWSPGHDLEIMTVPQLIERFAVEGLSKKAAVFDTQKLEWMNGQHLALRSSADLAPMITAALVAAGATSEALLASRRDWYLGLIELFKIRSRTVDEIVQQMRAYFHDEVEYDPAAVAAQWSDRAKAIGLLSATRVALAELDAWTPAALETRLRALAQTLDIGAGKLFQPVRVALTGLTASPGLFDVLMVLGRERALIRLDAALTFLGSSPPS